MLLSITLLEAAKLQSLATPPPSQSSKSGFILSAPIFVCSRACPRPERFSRPYYHVFNNNTQGRILHFACSRQLRTPHLVSICLDRWSAFFIISSLLRTSDRIITVAFMHRFRFKRDSFLFIVNFFGIMQG